MVNNNLAHKIFRREVLDLSAYHVADAAGLIKLDAMENPFHWPDDIKAEWLNALKDCEINRYPDPEAKELTEKIKKVNNIPDGLAVILGNGSDEIIQMLLMALPPDACVLSVQPTFVMYQQISRSLGLNYISVPLVADDFSIDLSAVLHAIDVHQPAIIFLAYPNNPTGNLFDANMMREIINTASGLVVVDEAYSPFAKASFINEIAQYDNLLVMRTVSKLGLAGLRLGYAVGKPNVIEQLHKIRLPYNINILTQVSALFALNHHTIFDEQTAILCAERSKLAKALTNIGGLMVYPSAANFILFRTQNQQAARIFNELKSKGVLIKNLSPQGGLLTDCLRVTVGKPSENQAFLEALKNSV